MGGRWRLWCEIIDATFGQVVSAITLSPALQAALPAASGSRSAGAAHTPRIPPLHPLLRFKCALVPSREREQNRKLPIQLAVWRINGLKAAPVLVFHVFRFNFIVVQPRAATSFASLKSGSTATGFATADSSGKSLIESL